MYLQHFEPVAQGQTGLFSGALINLSCQDNIKTAIRLNPDNARFYRNLALVYSQQGKTSEAEAVMNW